MTRDGTPISTLKDAGRRIQNTKKSFSQSSFFYKKSGVHVTASARYPALFLAQGQVQVVLAFQVLKRIKRFPVCKIEP